MVGKIWEEKMEYENFIKSGLEPLAKKFHKVKKKWEKELKSPKKRKKCYIELPSEPVLVGIPRISIISAQR